MLRGITMSEPIARTDVEKWDAGLTELIVGLTPL